MFALIFIVSSVGLKSVHHKNISLSLKVMPMCAHVQFTMEMKRMLTIVPNVHQENEVTLLQSFLIFKDHGDHQETHGKEELTKSVVLEHVVAVTTVVPQLEVKAEQREDRGGHCRTNMAERDSFWNKVLAFGAVFVSV